MTSFDLKNSSVEHIKEHISNLMKPVLALREEALLIKDSEKTIEILEHLTKLDVGFGEHALNEAIGTTNEFKTTFAVPTWLIEHGANVNKRNRVGWTPILSSVYMRDL